MKTLFILGPCGLIFVSAALAANPDQARLKENYQAAIKRVEEPIKTTYEKELRKLLEKQTKAGNLAAANEVNAELEELHKADPPAAPEGSPSNKSIGHYFVGKSFSSSNAVTTTFLKNGAGYRQHKAASTLFTWHLTDNGLAEAQMTEGKTATFYFRFVSPVEAYMGTSSDNVTERMTVKH